MMSPEDSAELEEARQRERRAAAVVRTAARVASERSLPATLTALAHEILQVGGLAGVQVLTNEHSGDKLHVLGIAGFPAAHSQSFFSRLMECKRRGADLWMLEAFEAGEPVIIPHRYEAVMNDPAWAPLHEFHRRPEWEAFASIPIKVRQATIGILNVFVLPGREIDDEGLAFLTTMAEQAGLAIHYASLLEQERTEAQREERRRLARDLHDSVVQQVFSMGMLVQTLKVLSAGDQPERQSRVEEIVTDLEEITGSVLKDLRGLVAQLRPSATAGLGLRSSLEKLASRIYRQTGVRVEVDAAPVPDDLDPEMVEDIYHVIAEAAHNAVKHSSADLVTISLGVDAAERIVADVRDNGGDPEKVAWQPRQSDGSGMTFMRQRVERWGGHLDVDPDFGGVGTAVHAEFPRARTRADVIWARGENGDDQA